MRLSVIGAAYNMAQVFSFDASVESILTQSFSDFEFIICDDGSTDTTYERLMSFAARDGRIKLLHNERNLGLAASLNRCLAAAQGEYIGRTDFDDISAHERFARQIEYLDSNPDTALLGTAAYLFDRGGVYAKRTFPQCVRRDDFLFASPYMHGSVVFRHEALLRAGGYRVARVTRRAEDYDLFMRMATFSRGANLTEPMYFYLEDTESARRRRYRYRIDEFFVRLGGFRALGLMPRGIPYAVKPLIVGLMPDRLLERAKRKYYGDRYEFL